MYLYSISVQNLVKKYLPQSTGLHVQKGHTSLGISSMQILLWSAQCMYAFCLKITIRPICVHFGVCF